MLHFSALRINLWLLHHLHMQMISTAQAQQRCFEIAAPDSAMGVGNTTSLALCRKFTRR